MRILLLVIFTSMLIILNACSSMEDWQGTNLDYKELEGQYKPRFFGEGKTLIVEVENIGGLNIVTITNMLYLGELYLGGIRNSSGGKVTSKFYIDVSRFNLKDDWKNHIYWWDDRHNSSPEDYNGKPIPDNARTKIIIKPFAEQ